MNEFLIMPKELSAGVYFVRVEAADFEKTEKIILLQ
ncbi:MAG: T9SS type A sorting domain-containing protein [bacterium]